MADWEMAEALKLFILGGGKGCGVRYNESIGRI